MRGTNRRQDETESLITYLHQQHKYSPTHLRQYLNNYCDENSIHLWATGKTVFPRDAFLMFVQQLTNGELEPQQQPRNQQTQYQNTNYNQHYQPQQKNFAQEENLNDDIDEEVEIQRVIELSKKTAKLENVARGGRESLGVYGPLVDTPNAFSRKNDHSIPIGIYKYKDDSIF